MFVTKPNPAGSGLVYSALLRGDRNTTDGQQVGRSIAVDGLGQAYVTGYTSSTTFPTTPNPYSTFNGGQDAFVTKLSADAHAQSNGHGHSHGHPDAHRHRDARHDHADGRPRPRPPRAARRGRPSACKPCPAARASSP